MASAVSSSVATTASRFALLQVESDSDTDSGSGKEGGGQGDNKCWASKVIPTMSKKKKKRREKKEQQQCEINELESEMSEADLQKALLLSALEYEEHKKVHENVENITSQLKAVRKKKKPRKQGKDKPLAVTLKSFQLDNNTGHIPKKHEEQNSSQSSLHDGGFFNRMDDDGHGLLKREKRRVQHIDCSKAVNCTSDEYNQEWVLRERKTVQLKLECEKKDAEIEQLKNIITQWEAKYKDLKARNAKLKKMHELEMKDKVELLQQTVESQSELTSQVTKLHAALEQERSKVKLLQTELSKYQKGKNQKN